MDESQAVKAQRSRVTRPLASKGDEAAPPPNSHQIPAPPPSPGHTCLSADSVPTGEEGWHSLIIRGGCYVSHSVVSSSFAALWTVARQAPLSLRFSRQEYRSGLPFPPPRGSSWTRD